MKHENTHTHIVFNLIFLFQTKICMPNIYYNRMTQPKKKIIISKDLDKVWRV